MLRPFISYSANFLGSFDNSNKKDSYYRDCQRRFVSKSKCSLKHQS